MTTLSEPKWCRMTFNVPTLTPLAKKIGFYFLFRLSNDVFQWKLTENIYYTPHVFADKVYSASCEFLNGQAQNYLLDCIKGNLKKRKFISIQGQVWDYCTKMYMYGTLHEYLDYIWFFESIWIHCTHNIKSCTVTF